MQTRRPLADAIDLLLELTVIGSFSRIGPAIRGRLDGWTDPSSDALVGRTAVVTGPTSGLGRATAIALARLGARVVLVGRDRERLETTGRELSRVTGTDRAGIVVADLTRLDEARAAAEQIRGSEARLDLLVDNAGAIFPERELTVDGIEATFALMVVSPFVLVAGLLERLRESNGRV